MSMTLSRHRGSRRPPRATSGGGSSPRRKGSHTVSRLISLMGSQRHGGAGGGVAPRPRLRVRTKKPLGQASKTCLACTKGKHTAHTCGIRGKVSWEGPFPEEGLL